MKKVTCVQIINHEERYEIHNALENRGGKIGSGRSRKYFTNIVDVNKRNASIRSNQWRKCMDGNTIVCVILTLSCPVMVLVMVLCLGS